MKLRPRLLILQCFMRFCVIGHPITHSRSPSLHEAGFGELGIEARFEAVDVHPDNLENWVKQEFPAYQGAAITIPHKQTIRSFLDAETEAAAAIGAVNTLYRQEGQVIGTNTDMIGAIKALQTQIPNLKGKTVLVLGAGGASRAVVFALVKAGARVAIYNRTYEKAVDLARDFGAETVEILEATDPQDIDIIINTTPVGMKSWESPLPENFWEPHHTGFDIVYDPLETKFLADAQAAGAKAITGDHMLVHQALEQFRIWHGVELEPEVMAEAFFRS